MPRKRATKPPAGRDSIRLHLEPADDILMPEAQHRDLLALEIVRLLHDRDSTHLGSDREHDHLDNLLELAVRRLSLQLAFGPIVTSRCKRHKS